MWGQKSMRRSSKTREEKAAEVAEAKARCWEHFHHKLRAVQSMAGAVELVSEAPPVGAPGRRYYTNLVYFLENFMPPGDANAVELGLYVQLIQHPDSLQKLKPEIREKAEKELKLAISQRDEDF